MPESDNQCNLESSSDGFAVFRACRGNRVCYRAHCADTVTYAWSATGGSIVSISDNDRLCCVEWGNGTGGFVTVTATRKDSSTCTGQVQIVLEDKPVIGLITFPNYVVDFAKNTKELEVCVGDSVVFVDNSISNGIPISDCYWEGPWGVSANHSVSFVPHTPGSYSVHHTVYNLCGCYDEEIIHLIVHEACPVNFSCYGTVCANTKEYYTLSTPICSDYLWSVEGGTILTGQHTGTVSVQWGAPASGYGMLYLDGSQCNCACKSRKSIRVPILSNRVPISGPDTLCVGQFGHYTLPLWGSTNYSWAVSNPENTSFASTNHQLEFSARIPGTYTLTATFRNVFLGCGPYTVDRTVVVRDTLSLTAPSGDTTVCIGTELTFRTSDTSASRWQVASEVQVLATIVGDTLSYAFVQPGVYQVTATHPGYCNSPSVIVSVPPDPSLPRNVQGPDTVCPGYCAEYAADPTSSDCFIQWQWWTDTGWATCSGSRVNITFGSDVRPLRLWQVNRRTGCHSDTLIYRVSPFQAVPFPYDTVRLCQGQTITLDRMFDQTDLGVLYEWKVDTARYASIQVDHIRPFVTLWGNYTNEPSPYVCNLVLKRNYCKADHFDTAVLIVGEIDPPQIVHGSLCKLERNLFTISDTTDANPSSCYWYLDDNTGSRINGLPASITFPDTLPHTVHLHYRNRFGCEAEASVVVSARMFPDVSIEEQDGHLCVDIPDGVSGLHFLWMTGDTSRCIDTVGDYSCTITDSNGCSVTLSGHPLVTDTCIEGRPFFIQQDCFNVFHVSRFPAGFAYPAKFIITHGNTSYKTLYTGGPLSFVVPGPDDFSVRLEWTNDDTCYYAVLNGSAGGEVLKFDVSSNCNGEIVVSDLSNFPIPPMTIEVFKDGMPFITSSTYADPFVINTSGSGQYRIVLSVDGWPECHLSYTVDYDDPPQINNFYVRDKMCDNTVFTFLADAVGSGLSYLWNFGDGSYNFGNGIEHVYGDGTHGNISVLLTVTNQFGCTDTHSQDVNIVHNNLEGNLAQTTFPCPSYPAHIEYDPYQLGSSYLWQQFPAVTTYQTDVYEVGNYTVEEYNIYGCRHQALGNVRYPTTPLASILCDTIWCQGDQVTAIGNVGDHFTYRWTVTTPTGLTHTFATPNCSFSASDTGLYLLMLTVTDDSCSSQTSDTIFVVAKPPTPTLGFCGNRCITDGPVCLQSGDSRSLLWSNGTAGNSTMYYYDGPVSAYYLDPQTGCRSQQASIDIARAPDFDGLLTGCYRVCDTALPDSLPVYWLGLSNPAPWHWHHNSSVLNYGTMPIYPAVQYLPVPTPGTYRLTIDDYGNGCAVTSPELSLVTVPCDSVAAGGGLPISGYVIGHKCSQEKCKLTLNLEVEWTNQSSTPVTVAGLRSSTYSVATPGTTFPLVIGSGSTSHINASFTFDFTQGNIITLYLLDAAGIAVGQLVYDNSDWMECAQVGDCSIQPVSNLQLLSNLSQWNQSVFFRLNLSLPSGSGTILAVWCDHGQLIDFTYGSSSATGLLMLDFGRLTQLVESQGEICFDVLCCKDNSLCMGQVCMRADLFYQMCQEMLHNKSHTGETGAGAFQPSQPSLRLVPNPAAGTVEVVDAATGRAAEQVSAVAVYSMAGQLMLAVETTGRFDVSALSDGAYIVRVSLGQDQSEYLKLIKKR